MKNEFINVKSLKDASKDIQPFLEYIIDQQTFDIFLQNVNHIVDQKHKNEIKKLSYKLHGSTNFFLMQNERVTCIKFYPVSYLPTKYAYLVKIMTK